MSAPFIVMDGLPGGYLARRLSSWDGPSTVKFQANQWMDNPTALEYLNWLSNCYPGEKIGLLRCGAQVD